MLTIIRAPRRPDHGWDNVMYDYYTPTEDKHDDCAYQGSWAEPLKL
jgi:hypothetical protein